MKIIYISHLDTNLKDGITKKILSQIKAINVNSNTTCEYLTRYDNKFQMVNEDRKIAVSKSYNKNILNNFAIFSGLNKQNNIFNNTDIIYIRHGGATRQAYKFFKTIKNKKKYIKIAVEIPTYPYDQEMNNNLLSKISIYIDKKYRLKYNKYVDYIVTFSEDQEIWGIPCINISNGIDLENTKLINKVEDDTITFTSVSICAPWHGLDRFLISLEKYLEKNSSVQVKFNIVGEGVETPKLKQIVNDSKHLKDVVVFHGFKSGEELDAIYNETDIAVGSLGRHRSGLTSLKTLKNREYAAKGLPMIYSEIDTDFEEQSFVHKVTPNEELIDLDKVIAWHQKLEMQPKEIREYAKQFSWDTQMKKVIGAIEEN